MGHIWDFCGCMVVMYWGLWIKRCCDWAYMYTYLRHTENSLKYEWCVAWTYQIIQIQMWKYNRWKLCYLRKESLKNCNVFIQCLYWTKTLNLFITIISLHVKWLSTHKVRILPSNVARLGDVSCIPTSVTYWWRPFPIHVCWVHGTPSYKC